MFVYREERGYGGDWLVGSYLTASDVLKEIERLFNAIVACAAIILLALLLAAWLGRRISRPVRLLAEQSRRVRNLDFEHTRPVPGSYIKELNEAAAAFNQMAARLQSVETTRRQLFGDLAHEIRTPVSVLEAYIEAVQDGVRDLDSKTVAMLREQTGRLVRFSADAAALAQAEEAQATIAPEPVDVAELVGAATAAVAERYAAKQVSLTSRVTGTTRFWADRQRLGQILTNLLDNALRHTPAHGHVHVDATSGAEAVLFTVTDDGEGVDAEHLPHLFERFYRADSARDRARGGAGIGLAIAKALAEAHGGGISVQSRGPGTGTTFTVSMPIRPVS